MIKKKEILYNTVVFYDLSLDQIDWQALYALAMAFMETYQQKPTRMSLSGTQVRPSSQTKSFRHYNKVIHDLNFKDIHEFWIGAGYSKDPGGDQDDCFIGFFVDCQYDREVVLYFRDDIIPYNTSLFKQLAANIVSASHGLYGSAFQIDQNIKDVLAYVLGILNPDDSEEMKSTLLNWDHAYNDPYKDCGTYKTGDLRDLYPLNFIGPEHLKRDVFGQTLEHWIQEDSARGTLEPLNDTLWTWEIPTEAIPTLRKALQPTDLLVCFRPYE